MKKIFALPAIVSSVVVTLLLLGVQRFGIFQTFELRVFDQMMQMRADSEPDSRLLIVAVTEEDIRRYGHPLSGQVLNNLLNKLTESEPRGIGLDIFRDLPVEPGHNQLLETLQLDDLIVPICEHAESGKPAIPAPTGIKPERVGFNDVVQDPDGTIRRNLLLLEPSANDACKAEFSFSLQLALKYLAAGGIQPQFNSEGELQLRDVVFKPLESNFGAYQNVDAGGDQILLNYRSPQQVARQVTVTDVLTDQVGQDLIKDRIILIGSTAPSLKDIQKTPYSNGKSDNSGDMAGVEIHATSVSQILSTVLNGQPLFWSFPDWGEAGWILVWSLAGGLIAFRFRHPVILGIAGVGILAILFAGNFFIFTQAGWIPVVTPALGLLLAGGSVVAYSGYQSKLEEERIAQILEDQKQAFAELQNHLKKNPEGDTTIIIHQEELPPNTLLDYRYKIVDGLGKGGFGRTYKAEDTKRPGNPICVVKQLRPSRSDEQFLIIARRLFETEGKILELLGRKHDQIPQLLAYFEEGGQFYLVQEYIDGQPLDKEIILGKPWEEARVVELLKEVLQVLDFVHSHGVIHRDVKPSNLMRRKSDGRIVLIDFGTVKIIGNIQSENLALEHQENNIVTYSVGYAPTEQIAGTPQLNTDIYALGIVAIQAFTGVDPKNYRRDNNSIVLVPNKSQNNGLQIWRNQVQVSEKLADIIDRMVERESADRYKSVAEVLKILQGL